jgi:hypothetical protein
MDFEERSPGGEAGLGGQIARAGVAVMGHDPIVADRTR